jgi:DNA-binding transcriptional regulator GbsR (MarR family)
MAGRVLGALLLADPPGMSSSQLCEFLGVSAGSVSTATRELIRPGLAVRVSVPGERQDYFRATFGANMPQFLHSRMELTRRWERLIRRGEDLAAAKDPLVLRQLEEIREFYEFLEAEYSGMLERWAQRRRSRR